MNINNLMDNVRDFFIEQYKGVENSNSFLSFEALGTMIDPCDFEAENDEISEIKAMEQLSILGDRLPQIDTIFFANSSRLSSTYEMLIGGAVFSGEKIGAEDKTPYIAKFKGVQSGAILKYDEAVKASIERPEGNYLPVYGTPSKWYDPNGSFWQKKTFSVSEAKDVAGSGSQNKPLQMTMIPFLWKTTLQANPKLLKPVVAPQVFLKPIMTIKDTKQKAVLHAHSSPVRAKTLVSATPITSSIKRTVAIAATPARKALIKSNVIQKERLNEITRESSHYRNPTLKANTVLKTQVNKNPEINQWANLKVLKHLDVAERIQFTSHIAKNNTAPQEPVRSNEFTMSFEYCIVNLERSWYDQSIFHYSKLWYGLSLEEDYFSSGSKDDSNKGVLKCIPTAMILIKNLNIKASWTNEDRKAAENSIGLGIFNLSESTFSNNELKNPGMQIIGWMCEVLPKLPIISDPNLIVEPE